MRRQNPPKVSRCGGCLDGEAVEGGACWNTAIATVVKRGEMMEAIGSSVRRRLHPETLAHQDQTDKHVLPPLSISSSPRSRRLFWVISPFKATLLMVTVLSVIIYLLLSVSQILGIRIFPRKAKVRPPPMYGIPKPPPEQMVSVIIMNHDRPYVLQRSSLLQTLLQHSSISEILLLHSNPTTAFEASKQITSSANSKIRDIDAVAMNDKMGLALRFHYCAESAQNHWVLIMDDDMEVDATAIDALLYHMHLNPKRVVGHFGRALKPPNFVRKMLLRTPAAIYDTKNVYGSVEVVLTKILLIERDICIQFENYMSLMEDLVGISKPFWNGEDIFVNLVANYHYGVPFGGPYRNFAVAELPVWEANVTAPSGNDVQSVSGNLDDSRLWKVGYSKWRAAYLKAQQHNRYRSDFWLTAKNRLWKRGPEQSRSLSHLE